MLLDRPWLIPTPPLPHSYGYRNKQRFFSFNLLSELREPDQWYLDREEGRLYLWPPGSLEELEIYVPVLSAPLIAVRGGSHIEFSGLIVEGGRGQGIAIEGGKENIIKDCTLRNLGGLAVGIKGDGNTVSPAATFITWKQRESQK